MQQRVCACGGGELMAGQGADPVAPVWRFYHGRGWPPISGEGYEDVDGLTWVEARSRAEMALGPLLDVEDDCPHCRAQAVAAALVLESTAVGERFHGEVDGADFVVVPMAAAG